MTDILVIANTVIVIAILIYFYFKDAKHTEETTYQITNSQDFIREINTSKDELLKEVTQSKDKLTNQNFKDFLTHIRKLEEMVLPKPVTKQMVNDIMYATPPLTENEIEKNSEDINQDNFMDVLSHIPIDNNTRVSFENEIDTGDVPEEILS